MQQRKLKLNGKRVKVRAKPPRRVGKAGVTTRSVTEPVARGNVTKQNGPKLASLPSGAIRVNHCERFDTITGTPIFVPNVYDVTPTNPALFPWLSRIAERYEMFVFEKLSIEYRTVSATTTPGKLMLGVDQDYYDEVPVNSITLETWKGTTTSPVWKNMTMTVPSAMLNRRGPLYTNASLLPNGADQRLNNVGRIFVATEFGTNSDFWGQVYVNYTIRLITPDARAIDPIPTFARDINKDFTYNFNVIEDGILLTGQVEEDLLNVSNIPKPFQKRVPFNVDDNSWTLEPSTTYTLEAAYKMSNITPSLGETRVNVGTDPNLNFKYAKPERATFVEDSVKWIAGTGGSAVRNLFFKFVVRTALDRVRFSPYMQGDTSDFEILPMIITAVDFLLSKAHSQTPDLPTLLYSATPIPAAIAQPRHLLIKGTVTEQPLDIEECHITVPKANTRTLTVQT